MKLVEALRDAAPEKLAALRQEYERLVSAYFSANMVRQGYLMTRATKNGE